MVAVGDAVCFQLHKKLQDTNEQGSVNDRQCGILWLSRGQTFFQWIKYVMTGNHTLFSSESCKISDLENARDRCTGCCLYLFLYMDLQRTLRHCVFFSWQGTEYTEQEIHNFLEPCRVGGSSKYTTNHLKFIIVPISSIIVPYCLWFMVFSSDSQTTYSHCVITLMYSSR